MTIHENITNKITKVKFVSTLMLQIHLRLQVKVCVTRLNVIKVKIKYSDKCCIYKLQTPKIKSKTY